MVNLQQIFDIVTVTVVIAAAILLIALAVWYFLM